MLIVVVLSWLALPEGKGHLVLLCIICASTLPLEQMRLNLNAIDQGSGNFRRFNAGRLVAAAAFPLLLLIAWASGAFTVATATYLLVPATLLALAFRLAWSDDYRPWRPGQPAVATILREGLPFAPSQAGGDLFNKLDSLLVLYLASSVQQGLYVAAVPAVQVLAVAPEALAVFAFNAGARNSRPHGHRGLAATIGGLLLFQVVSAVVYAFLLPTLIVWVYKSEFAGAIPLALALLPGMVFQGCTTVADGYLRGRGIATPGIWARGLGAVVMCLAALLLCQAHWKLAVPVAASLGNIVSAVWIGAAVLRSTRHDSPQIIPEPAEAYSP
jgi:O-antigen/teichoic acid export membrane protein